VVVSVVGDGDGDVAVSGYGGFRGECSEGLPLEVVDGHVAVAVAVAVNDHVNVNVNVNDEAVAHDS
jgi:predicted Abi (CAAX) family protease